MDYSTLAKEEMIKNFIMSIDFKNGNWSIRGIKEGLKGILHEMPAVEVKHGKKTMISEVLGVETKTVQEGPQSIVVAFIDGDNSNGTPRVHKFEYFI